MKKAKLTLGLVAGLVATIGLASCNEVTYNQGVVLTYTDAEGNRVDYTATELFGDYEKTSSAASTDFEKVYELLIRHYFADDSQKSALAAINKKAQSDVNAVKQNAEKNAKANGTSYETELEKLLSSNNCDNIDELFDLKQYDAEKTQFESAYYNNNIDQIRDGVYSSASTFLGNHAAGDKFFPAKDDTYGDTANGYLIDKMPYHVRHILVKVTAANNDLTEGTISEANATKIGTVIEELAGAVSGARQNFGAIALGSSDDTSSGALYGDLGVMDKGTSFVQEFKLGVYAYDALYNQSTTSYRTANKANLLPPSDVKVTANGTEESVKDFFTAGETYDDSTTGIGQIPYGAAVAILASAKQDGSSLEKKPNNGSEVYYPRNILFNKYFNKHNVCVITPNEISFNSTAAGSATFSSETFDGTYSATYGALAGFSVDTKNILPAFAHNVLTDSEGQIILAVRAGTSGSNAYEGIHFITIQRSAFDKYGHAIVNNQYTEYTSDQGTAVDTPNLSTYYTVYAPGEDGYPTYTPAGGSATNMTTYINLVNQDVSKLKDRRDKLVSSIKTYNGNISNYMFQQLISAGSIKFANASIQTTIQEYIKQKRTKTGIDDAKTWDDAWRTYAEYLINQDVQRGKGVTTGKGPLISETCAINYTSSAAQNGTGDWDVGGVCYGK